MRETDGSQSSPDTPLPKLEDPTTTGLSTASNDGIAELCATTPTSSPTQSDVVSDVTTIALPPEPLPLPLVSYVTLPPFLTINSFFPSSESAPASDVSHSQLPGLPPPSVMTDPMPQPPIRVPSPTSSTISTSCSSTINARPQATPPPVPSSLCSGSVLSLFSFDSAMFIDLPDEESRDNLPHMSPEEEHTMLAGLFLNNMPVVPEWVQLYAPSLRPASLFADTNPNAPDAFHVVCPPEIVPPLHSFPLPTPLVEVPPLPAENPPPDTTATSPTHHTMQSEEPSPHHQLLTGTSINSNFNTDCCCCTCWSALLSCFYSKLV